MDWVPQSTFFFVLWDTSASQTPSFSLLFFCFFILGKFPFSISQWANFRAKTSKFSLAIVSVCRETVAALALRWVKGAKVLPLSVAHIAEWYALVIPTAVNTKSELLCLSCLHCFHLCQRETHSNVWLTVHLIRACLQAHTTHTDTYNVCHDCML